VGVERTAARRARPGQWRDILATALVRQEAVSVRGTVISHLHRSPTRAEITAARRAAHGLAASGRATNLRAKPLGFDGPGSPHLILARPEPLWRADCLTNSPTRPSQIAQDLAISVEIALEPYASHIPADRINPSDAERLVASLEASLDALRRIRSHLRRAT
jgi:hypothetical protein